MINAFPHCYILSLNIKSFPPSSLCLKQRQLYSKNLLDAFPVNPLSMFLYKHVFERARRKADKQGLCCGAWLVIVTMLWVCRPTGRHYLAHKATNGVSLCYKVASWAWPHIFQAIFWLSWFFDILFTRDNSSFSGGEGLAMWHFVQKKQPSFTSTYGLLFISSMQNKQTYFLS